MSGDLKAQLELSADASGVETGVANAKKSLASLGASAQTAGKQASDGLAKAGDGADAGAAKIDRATQNIIGSIQRQIAVTEAGGRGTAAYFEAIAKQRNVSADVLGPYLAQLRETTAAQEALASASAQSAALEEASIAKRAAAFGRLRDSVAQLNYKDQIAAQAEQAASAKAVADADESATARRVAAFNQLRTTVAQLNYKQQIAAEADLAASLQKTEAAQRSFLASLREQVATKNLDASGLLTYRAAQLGVTQEAAGLIAQLKLSESAFAKNGMSAAQMANNLRMVGPQVTDIVTQLQGGQNPLTVFIQQGGQLKDIFGGIGPAARALGGYVIGLVNPFTVAAAAGGLLLLAYHQGASEADAYAKALILTGNAAGTNVGQLSAMARAVSAVAGTQGLAAEALAALASTGQVAATNLELAATAAVRFERTAGQSIAATAKEFEELGKAPLDASVKLNEKLNYLTLSTYAQIKAFQDQGREADAAAAAQKAYADALVSRATQIEARLGTIERAWIGIKDAAKGAWDSMLNVGRADTLQNQLASAQSELQRRQERGPLNPTTTGAFEKGNQALRDRIAILQESIGMDNRAAAASKAAADQVQARIKFDKDGEQFLQNAVKMEREITKARNEGAIAGASQAEIESRIADIRKKYEDKGATKLALGIDKAQLSSDIDALKKASDQLVGIYANQEKILEAQHAAGGLSDAEYYQKKRDLIITESEIQDYVLQQQIKRYQAEKLAGKDAIDVQKKIGDTQAELSKLRDATAEKLTVLSVQQETAAKKLALAFLTARQAAQDYFDNVNKQQARDLGGVGQGTQARTLNAGINQIEDRYSSQRRDLENQKAQLELEGKFTADARAQYEERLRIINEFQDKSTQSYIAYYQKLIALQGDASLGAQEALRNYFDESQQLGKQTEAIVGKSLNGLEDAFVTFATTGKLSFKSLADSIIADIIRIQVKAAIANAVSSSGSIAGFIGTIGSIFSGSYDSNYSHEGLNFGGPRAAGGPVSPGTTYLVGEKGPELLQMGSQAGTIAANSAWSGSGERKVIVNNNYATGADVRTRENDQGDLEVIIEEAASRAEARINRSIGSGSGGTATALRSRGIGLNGSNKRRN